MAEPFPTRARALVFGAFVLAISVLPLGLDALHRPSRAQRFASTPIEAGPYSFLVHEIYEETAPLDVAFVGDSVLWVGIDALNVRESLSRALDRPARVVTLGWNWRGEDLTYHVLRDLLARRRVRAVVLRLPVDTVGNRPHPQSFRWLTSSDDDVQAGLPWIDRATTYAIATIGGPRNLLSVVRPNLLSSSPYASKLGSYLVERGPDGLPFRAMPLGAPSIPSSRMLSTLDAASNPVTGPSSAMQRAYAAGIRTLLEVHGVRAVFLRFPADGELPPAERTV